MKNSIKFCLLEVTENTASHREDSPKQEPSIDDQKYLAWFEQGVSAWLQTKMEHDKIMLTISSILVGFIATIYAALIKNPMNLFQFAIMLTSIISFVVCMITTAIIFDKNAGYLKACLFEEDDSEIEAHEKKLSTFDSVSKWSFIIGISAFVAFIFFLGICAIQAKCLSD